MPEHTRQTRTPNEISTERFETKCEVLPDGEYIGRALVLIDVVANQLSPDYGRREFRMELAITDGPHRGKIASYGRVVLPHYLANVPPMDCGVELKNWRGKVKNYLKQTDVILAKCGIDTSNPDKTSLVKEIANNNRLKPIVKFNVINGVPRVINVIDYTVAAVMFSGDEYIPDGNDALF